MSRVIRSSNRLRETSSLLVLAAILGVVSFAGAAMRCYNHWKVANPYDELERPYG